MPAARHFRNLYPDVIFQAAFCHDEMDVGFEAEVAAALASLPRQ
jgi:hypothetical protein